MAGMGCGRYILEKTGIYLRTNGLKTTEYKRNETPSTLGTRDQLQPTGQIQAAACFVNKGLMECSYLPFVYVSSRAAYVLKR